MTGGDLISAYSLAVCSILLSFGGFIHAIAYCLPKSRCKEIDCCCGLVKINREILIEKV
tara:strand:+ start:2253 stop:2429 length:177 start_codon:yes stop_codon:yes gene_type:complete